MEDHWYVLDGTDSVGPMTTDDMKSKIASKVVHGETLVWAEGQNGWMPAGRTTLAVFFLEASSVQEKHTIAPSAPTPSYMHAGPCVSWGVLAAVTSCSLAAMELPGAHLIYGIVFGLFVGFYFYSNQVFSTGAWICFIAFTTFAYVIAYAGAYIAFHENYSNAQQIAFVVGAAASATGVLVVFVGLLVARQSWCMTLPGVVWMIIFPIMIGGFAMDFSIARDSPTDNWPRNKTLLYLIHVPWQAVFAFGMATTYRVWKSSR